jgi:prepilin-type N-terminal cleavage/methylation domain-containing protein
MKKRNFTLIEVMISLALLALLLGFLFTYFRQTLMTKNKAGVLKEKVMRIELFQVRLGALFDRFSNESDCFVTNQPHGDAVGSALLLYCDHGIDPNPSFSGLIHSMLFKTRDHTVCLCSWSKQHKAKVDVLLKGVKELSFEFFNGKQWRTTWPKDKKDEAFPKMIKISVLMQGEEEQRQDFIFSLSSKAESYLK